MTLHDTRVRLLRTVLRSGSTRRIRRVLDRMDGADLSRLLGRLSTLDLRRSATILLAADRLDQTLSQLDGRLLERLVVVATQEDALRALATMPTGQAAATLRTMAPARRGPLMEGLKLLTPHDSRPVPSTAVARTARSSVLRLRRLFLFALVR